MGADYTVKCLLFVAALHVSLAAMGSINDTPKQNARMDTMEAQKRYLERYHYLGDMCPDSTMRDMAKSSPMEAFQKAVRLFQHRKGLEPTGIVDHQTQEAMEKPRCGFPDIITEADMIEESGTSHRSERYALIGTFARWDRTDLTYKILNDPSGGLLTSEEARDAIRDAVQAWAEVSGLDFTEIPRGDFTAADITVSFESGNHDDGFPFDGPRGELAHIVYSTVGQWGDVPVHCDDAEYWDRGNSYSGVVDLYIVVVHEIGHTLGLAHSLEADAIMYDTYSYRSNPNLDIDDIRGIQYLYGPNPDNNNQPDPVTPSVPNDFCSDPSIDAAIIDRNFRLYFFKGNKVGQVLQQGVVLGDISDLYDDNIPDDLNAGLYIPTRYYDVDFQCNWVRRRFRCAWVYKIKSSNQIFFKGSDLYNLTYASGQEYTVERTSISNVFSGIPTPVDAAFFGVDNRIYIIKGNEYWLVDMISYRSFSGYPRTLGDTRSPFRNLDVSSLDGGIMGMRSGDVRTNYVFKDDDIFEINIRNGDVLSQGSLRRLYQCTDQMSLSLSDLNAGTQSDILVNNGSYLGLEEYIAYIDKDGNSVDPSTLSEELDEYSKDEKYNGQSSIHIVSPPLLLFIVMKFIV